MKTVLKTLLCLLVLSGAGGCKSQKDYLYLADMTDDQGYAITQRFQPTIQRDDKLQITVSCKNPELAVPFNVTPGTLKVSENGKVGGSVDEQFYRVDNEGDINFPVLGAANHNGTHTCDGDRITLLEAIAQAGDLANNADLGKIAVIREEGSTRKVYTVDIRRSDIFNSPAYYLAQNDIVYVRPKKPKSEEKTNSLQWLTVTLSIVTATTSVIWVTKH